MLLQRLATGATGVKQARYRRGPTRCSEALVRACAVNTACLLVVALAVQCETTHGVYEFRRGFCTSVLSLSCVYLSVPALAASASIETSNQRYLRVSRRLLLDFDSWIFEKTFLSKVIAWKSQYANKLELTVSRFRAVSGPTKHSSYVKGNWWVECCLRG